MHKLLNAIIISAVILTMATAICPAPLMADDFGYVFTLSEAKEMAVKNSPKITSGLLDEELARVNERDAWVAYEQAKANYVNTAGKVESIKLAMEAAKKAYDAAVNARKDGAVNMDKLKMQVAHETETLYLQLLSMDNTIEMMRKNYDMQVSMARIETVKYNLGMSTQFAVDQQRQKTMEVERQLTTLNNTKTSMQWSFNRSIGRNPEQPFGLAPVTFQAVEHEDQKGGEKKAKEELLAIEQFNRTIEDKRLEIQDKLYTASDKVEKLELEIDQLSIKIEDTEYSVSQAMKNLHEDLALTRQKLIDDRSTYDMAQKQHDAEKLQYELGMIAKIAYEATEVAFAQKKADYEQAVYDYYLATKKVSLAEQGILLN